MSVHYFNKSAENKLAISQTSVGLLAGPLNVEALESVGFTIFSCSTQVISISPKVSIDKAREFEADFPMGALQNTGAISLGGSSGQSVVRTLKVPNTLKWVSFMVSSTAVITSGTVKLFIHGKMRG